MRKFTSVLLALVLCAALLCIGAAADGSGDVIEIDTPEELAKIGKNDDYPLDGNYILTADIDLGGIEDDPWTPIGSDKEHAFTGTFDGNGHTIRELYINSNSKYAGLFGYVGARGTVKNLTVEGEVNRNATGLKDAYTGGIVGYNGGTVEGCTNKCDVTVSANDYACTGGITGINYGTVSYCNNSGCVSGQTTVSDMPSVNTGGVVGYNAAGDISNCYNTGAVTGSGGGSYHFLIVITGGVVGQNYNGSVSDCYNTGAVKAIGSGYAGGVAGFNGYSGYRIGTVESCYNIGTVRVESEGSGSAGGVVGWNEDRNDNIDIVTGCFYLKQDGLKGIGNGGDSETGVSGLDKEQFAVPDNFSNDWNYTNIWIIDTPSEGGFARPMLRYNLETAEGSGTESDPYIIPDLEMLEFYRDMINTGSDSKYNGAHYILTDDIELDGEEKPWTPIGSNKDHAFTGTFDGNGHTISELYINSNSEYAGLFGCVGTGGMIKDLTVEGEITVSGSTSCVGGIAGIVSSSGQVGMSVLTDSNDSKMGIIDCTSKVTINVTYNGSSVGGIVGSCGGATISGCENYGAVSVVGASKYGIDVNIGGVVGDNNEHSDVSNCYNTGAVSAQNAEYADIGGVVGDNNEHSDVSNCYNTGAVSVQNVEEAALGGVVGYNDDESTVSNCYNTGAVSAENAEYANLGGVVGENDGSVSNCYNTGDVTTENVEKVDAGGAVGYNYGTVSNCNNTGEIRAENVECAAVGGVVGRNSSGAVSNSYNTGDVNAKASSGASVGDPVMAGGVVGYNSYGEVTDCYNTGDVSGRGNSGAGTGEDDPPVMAGGVVGNVHKGTVSNCYSIGTVSGENTEETSVGGVAGYKDGDAVSSCYYLEQGSLPGIGNDVDNDDATPLTKEQFADTYSFTDWDFNNTWTIVDMGGFERPVLIDNKETVVTYTVTVNGSYAGETGAGSYLAGESVTVSAGERAGYSFAGWTAEGVDLADASAENVTFTMPANDVTLTAEWDYIVTPGDPTYRPIIDEPENGGVTTSPSRPEAGDTVTVNPEPDEGYEVDEIIVTDKDGNPVEVTRNPDGSYTFTQPEGAVTIEVTFRPASGLPFTDVAEGDWFYDYVEYVYENGLMDGTSDTTFEPNANMTRAMVWAILARIDGETVTGANWVETAREWAMASGVSDGTDADGYVTREQLATMLWRYAGEPASDYSLSAFTDADSVSDYAATAMAWAVEHGIITGVTDTTLVPQGTATRAQCAAMLMRFVENVK